MKLWCVESLGKCNTKIWHQTSRRASDYRHKNITRPTFPASALRQSEGLTLFSINLLVVYRESVNLIGYLTRSLSADISVSKIQLVVYHQYCVLIG